MYQPKAKSLSKKLMTLFVFTTTSFTLLVCVSVMLLMTKEAKANPIISPLATPIQETYASIRQVIAPDLGSTVIDALRGTDGEYAIVIKNLDTGETFMQNENKQFISASLYKLWTMATAYTQFENGKLKPTDYLTRISSQSASLGSGGMTAADAISKAIVISDNYSAQLLNNRVTIKAITSFLRDSGMSNTTRDVDPRTTAADTALFYEKLYNKSLVSKDASMEMLQILRQQRINDRIPKYLPTYIQVAHKTGELDGNKHDAGIVYTPKGDYIFVALSNTNNPAIAAERIAVLSQRVYAYFTKE